MLENYASHQKVKTHGFAIIFEILIGAQFIYEISPLIFVIFAHENVESQKDRVKEYLFVAEKFSSSSVQVR